MYTYYEEGREQVFTESELQKLWDSKIDHSNFSDYEEWKNEMIRMQIIIPKVDVNANVIEKVKEEYFENDIIMSELIRSYPDLPVDVKKELLNWSGDEEYVDV